MTTAQLARIADVSISSPPLRSSDAGAPTAALAGPGDVIRNSNVLCGGSQMVGGPSSMVAYPLTGCATTLATGFTVEAINHLSHRERCSLRTSSGSP
jgi:hypothetical protein